MQQSTNDSNKTALMIGAGVLAGISGYILYQKINSENKSKNKNNIVNPNEKFPSKGGHIYRRSLIKDNLSYDVFVCFVESESCYYIKNKIEFEVVKLESLYVDMHKEGMTSMKVNGADVKVSNFDMVSKRISISSSKLKLGSNVIEIEAKLSYNKNNQGIVSLGEPSQGVVTMNDTYGASQIIPCFDQNDMKGNYRVTVLYPKSWTILSNEKVSKNSENVSSFKSSEFYSQFIQDNSVDEDNMELAIFMRSKLMSPSGFCLIGGQMNKYISTNKYKLIKPTFYMSQEIVDKYSLQMEMIVYKFGVAQVYTLDLFNKLFGSKYPFSKLETVFLDTSNKHFSHPGCIIIDQNHFFQSMSSGDENFPDLFNTLINKTIELWFGNLINASTWKETYLMKGLSKYLTYIIHEKLVREETFELNKVKFLKHKETGNLYKDHILNTESEPNDCSQRVYDKNLEADPVYLGQNSWRNARSFMMFNRMESVCGESEMNDFIKAFIQKFMWKTVSMKEFMELVPKSFHSEFSNETFDKEDFDYVRADFNQNVLSVTRETNKACPVYFEFLLFNVDSGKMELRSTHLDAFELKKRIVIDDTVLIKGFTKEFNFSTRDINQTSSDQILMNPYNNNFLLAYTGENSMNKDHIEFMLQFTEGVNFVSNWLMNIKNLLLFPKFNDYDQNDFIDVLCSILNFEKKLSSEEWTLMYSLRKLIAVLADDLKDYMGGAILSNETLRKYLVNYHGDLLLSFPWCHLEMLNESNIHSLLNEKEYLSKESMFNLLVMIEKLYKISNFRDDILSDRAGEEILQSFVELEKEPYPSSMEVLRSVCDTGCISEKLRNSLKLLDEASLKNLMIEIIDCLINKTRDMLTNDSSLLVEIPEKKSSGCLVYDIFGKNISDQLKLNVVQWVLSEYKQHGVDKYGCFLVNYFALLGSSDSYNKRIFSFIKSQMHLYMNKK